METRVDKVAEKHKSGYNCAQAVACAYCDLVGIDEETMFCSSCKQEYHTDADKKYLYISYNIYHGSSTLRHGCKFY